MTDDLNLDDLRRLFDLAVDSPLICSGSFESDDVELLARLAVRLGVDPWATVTSGTEFESRFPHPFRRRHVNAEVGHVLEKYTAGDMTIRNVRSETGAEAQARIAEERADLTCQVNRCGKPIEDPIHTPGREQ